jgi:hypothetical protein
MNPHKALPASPPELADDLLLGAEEIAKFIYGPKGNRRQVYYLVQYARLPVFRLGTMLCARRSVLMNWIAMQESRVLYAMDTEMERLAERSTDQSCALAHSQRINPLA